jgi:UDPglucose--hexose-1-phosphate uridylyltransferase
MHSQDLIKPDGRHLTLYSNRPIPDGIVATSPFAEPQHANPHLRWHALRGEWVAYAAFRQNRTYQPPPQYNPLAPTRDPAHPTEMPAGDYEIAVFDNRFPSLAPDAHEPPTLTVPSAPANGQCEVVVFTQDPQAALGRLPLARIELLLEVWADRTRRLTGRNHIQYVLPFENRGAEVGVTLHHPHGQIYAYPFVPASAARALEMARRHRAEQGSGLFCGIVAAERAGERVVARSDRFVAFVPEAARWPYEVHVYPYRHVTGLPELDGGERLELMVLYRDVLRRFDRLFDAPAPYIAHLQQAPSGKDAELAHLSIRIFTPRRAEGKLKYLAASETGAGAFINDVLPEEAARRLRTPRRPPR